MNNQSPSPALAARVKAVNRANAEVNKLAPIYRAVFERHTGKRVTKVDGTLTKAIQAELKHALDATGVALHPSCSMFMPHVGCFVVKTYETTAQGHTYYAEPYFYAFTESREGGLCQKLGHEWEPRRADYTPEQVMALRQNAKEAARLAANACEPFGLSDR